MENLTEIRLGSQTQKGSQKPSEVSCYANGLVILKREEWQMDAKAGESTDERSQFLKGRKGTIPKGGAMVIPVGSGRYRAGGLHGQRDRGSRLGKEAKAKKRNTPGLEIEEKHDLLPLLEGYKQKRG